MPNSPKSEIVYIGLGSNLGDSTTILKAANRALAALAVAGTFRRASLYKSAPVGTDDQPDFINSVSVFASPLAADELLHNLMQIEQEFGRKRSGKAGQPRTLDLDLLLFGESLINTDGLTVPHPRLHQRAFVLYPLRELAPELIIPGQGPVSDLLKQCEHQRLERLVGSSNDIE